MSYEADEFNLLEEVKKADSGDVAAMQRVGHYIAFHDPRVELEVEEAQRALGFLHAAADAGSLEAMVDIGDLYRLGRGVVRADRDIRYWYGRATFHGFARAYGRLGDFWNFYTTANVLRPDAAYVCYVKGAFLHDVVSLYRLGDFYRTNEYWEAEPPAAFDCYLKAYSLIDNGHNHEGWGDVCLRLGKCYASGCGVEVDLSLASELCSYALRAYQKHIKDLGDADGRVQAALDDATRVMAQVVRELDKRDHIR